MKQQQSGFTLIELVVVIVILGILAATALPRFVDFRGDAGNAAAEGVAGALSSASAMNFARSQITGAAFTAITSATATTDCGSVTGLLQAGFPTGLVLSATSNCTTAGTTFVCNVNNAANGANTSATATITCTG